MVPHVPNNDVGDGADGNGIAIRFAKTLPRLGIEVLKKRDRRTADGFKFIDHLAKTRPLPKLA